MNASVSDSKGRLLGAVSLIALGLLIGGYSFTHILAPHEPLAGRVIGSLTVVGITVPLITGGLWIWTADHSLTGTETMRLLGWCGAGMISLLGFSSLVVFYQLQHGATIEEPVGTLIWISGSGAVGGLLTGVYDIKRIEAFQHQQRTAERLSGLSEAAPVPIIEHDLDGTVRRWNNAAEQVFGWDADEAIGHRLPFLSESDASQDEFVALQNRILTGEQLSNVEIRRQTKNGESRDFLLSTAPVHEENDGSLTSVIGVLIDVTQQKRQQNQLELFRTLLDYSNDSIFLVDAETGEFVDVNQTACNQLGYDKEELLELSVLDVETTLSTEGDWQSHIDTIREEGSLLYEGTQERKDGSTFPVEVNIAHAILDQEYTVAIARDISERKARERELSQFKKAVEHAGYAIYITNRDGIIQYANPAFEDLTDYSPSEAVGNDPSFLQSGEHGEEYYQRLWNTILAGQVWEEEIVNQRRSGERYTAQQTIAPIFVEGTIDGFVAIQSDTTARQLREQQLSVLNRILRHNLRNAVNVISGNANLLRTDIKHSDSRTYLNKIDCQAQTLASLSDKAQTVTSALDGTRSPRHLVPVIDILRTEIDSFEDEYPNANITIDNQTKGSISVDASIRPVLEELLENALKHNDQPCPIVKSIVERNSSGDWVSIAVADDGPGIPDTDRFPLTNDAPESPLHHSSGIGLWLIKWVTTALGGTVAITDNEPRGSIVTVSLPVISDPDRTAGRIRSSNHFDTLYGHQKSGIQPDDPQ